MATAQDLQALIAASFPTVQFSLTQATLKSTPTVQFFNAVSPQDAASIQAIVAGFDFNALPPDVVGLAEAVYADPVMQQIYAPTSLPVKFSLLQFESLIGSELPKGPAGVQRVKDSWSIIKQTFPADVTKQVEALAVQFRVPIV